MGEYWLAPASFRAGPGWLPSKLGRSNSGWELPFKEHLLSAPHLALISPGSLPPETLPTVPIIATELY
jgi:hypothetical protein